MNININNNLKMNKLIYIGFLILLFSIKLNGQSNLVNITSESREGYQDLILSIVDTMYEDDSWIITAKGKFKETIVGIRINLKDNLKPGLVDGRIDNTSWARKATKISSLGQESDNFVKIISDLYGIKTEKAFTKSPIVFTCFSLNSVTAVLEKGYYEFKLYFDDANKSGIYTEVFLSLNLSEGYIKIPDRNPIYRESFVKAMIR